MKIYRIIMTLALALTLVVPAYNQAAASENLILQEGEKVAPTEGTDGEPKIVDRMGDPGPRSPQNPMMIPLDPNILEQTQIAIGGEPTPEVLEKQYKEIWEAVAQKYNRPEKLTDWHTWKHKYDGKLKTPEDLENALSAMLGSLDDQWASYTTTAEMNEARERFMNGIVESGIFAEVGEEGEIRINSLMYGTSAYKSELRKGDILKKIGDVDVTGKTKEELEDIVRGKVGTYMKVVFERDGVEKTISLELSQPERNGVSYRILPGTNYGYIRLDEFDAKSASEFTQGLIKLHMQANGHLTGLVLDLRGNPGGRVDLAKKIAEIFIEEGTIFKIKTREGRQVSNEVVNISKPMEHEFIGKPPHLVAAIKDYHRIPMVVLVDGSSVSSSEILTGALKDNGRATIMGTTTWGKAVGMIVFNIAPGGRVSITSLDYLTPSGYNLGHKGIEPHIVVERHSGAKFDEQLDAAIDFLTAKADDPFAEKGPQHAVGPDQQTDFFNSPLGISIIVALLFAVVFGVGYDSVLKRRKRRKAEEEANKRDEIRRY